MKKHIQPFNFQLSNFLTSLIFYLAILVFIISFNFSDTPPLAGGWYQQWMPNLNGRSIVDITFTDSLNGFAITNYSNDTSFILRSTNGGDNWFYSHFNTGTASYYNIQFINQSTGFVSGYIYDGSLFKIVKTTDAGISWFYINSAFDVVAVDMYALSQDTIWLTDGGALSGGVFRTTNGGASWQQQLALGNSNPDHIYMYSGRIGFICKTNSYIRKTTNSGLNWDIIVNGEGFSNMYFKDSLTGWKFYTHMKKTTNGGINWTLQTPISGGMINTLGIPDFSVLNRDTLISPSGYIIYPNNQTRGVLFRTTDGGNNWKFQIPDTSIHIGAYDYIEFSNDLFGWVYKISATGIHTTTGGDSIWITDMKQISSELPKQIKLGQNYPNPFNTKAKLKIQISKQAKVQVRVYDLTGRMITTLAEGTLNPGEYEINFDGTNYSSGVYFYSMYADGKLIDTKKMILLK
jgi:photosystem II stability/assembly factor-like uncharacterized protein